MIDILSAFDKREAMYVHASELLYVPGAHFDQRNMRLTLGNVRIHYRVVSNMQDVMQIAGHAFQLVEWHYVPSDEVRNWVMSRVRGVV